ncbi:MAG: hypothetical protein QXR48_00390 [Candidatus Woesearchaeota archaeon]
MQAIPMGQTAPDDAGLPHISDGRGPEKKFRAGAVSATVWKNDRVKATGESFSYHTISLERSYKDKSGNWKNANSFRIQDLPKAALVIQEAYRHLTLNGAQSEEVVVE